MFPLGTENPFEAYEQDPVWIFYFDACGGAGGGWEDEGCR